MTTASPEQRLSDPQSGHSTHALPLSHVGMSNIALPVRILGQGIATRADIGVSLDNPDARGIHMSRLYQALPRLSHEELSPGAVRQLLECALDSQAGLSCAICLQLRGELLLERPALVSNAAGYKAYPFWIEAGLDESGYHLALGMEIAYSSTCPCSAALSRELAQQHFLATFKSASPSRDEVARWLASPAGMPATPHAQRSLARIHLQLRPHRPRFPWLDLLEQAEAALGTPVQSLVKRQDEQAFALANGQNLMFCEDAARRLHLAISQLTDPCAFRIEVRHLESLHGHDAVAVSEAQLSPPS
ncbi:GTP cyclohydrolase FolE2 [Zobellella sp. DQSA1]|uniref:GTP cyclohydrolase FolE2 n=1 Tax=Zobellella sp. DQSA1 TaxID=3342386 RepID=UPI0035BF0779